MKEIELTCRKLLIVYFQYMLYRQNYRAILQMSALMYYLITGKLKKIKGHLC